MFKKILIANRGEIACRVAATARRLGIRTVAVYSDADMSAMHVAACDQAVHIGGSAPQDSYLRADRIIAAARNTGAEAIHPGYGFLSENEDFAQACADAGLVFIGPPPSAVRSMGLKSEAKRLMQQAGVPVLPGYHGPDQNPALLRQEADRIGYPVLIKASAGGGGKGMRKVESPGEFDLALQSCKREAQSSFGDDAMLVEKYAERPRHIEIQVFGDTHGNFVHLFERDCSVQRRHQKVLEEAPAPGMTDSLRQQMGAAAVAAARAVGYVGAGTVEFIVEQPAQREMKFYFMEMNTRLQVEHPVTEAITGLDLVEWQLRVACGEKLPLTQDELKITGHAIEARICAENPDNQFLPDTGTLQVYQRPQCIAFAPGTVRIDDGVRAGDAISPFYDPMIGKLTVHGRTREDALALLDDALARVRIVGLRVNVQFLRYVVRSTSFSQAILDTALIERERAVLFDQEPLGSAFAVACSVTRTLLAERATEIADPFSRRDGWRAYGESLRRFAFEFHGKPASAELTCLHDGSMHLATGDVAGVLWFAQSGAGFEIQFAGKRSAAEVFRLGEVDHVFAAGGATRITSIDLLAHAAGSAIEIGRLTSPMPGKVVSFAVEVGDKVIKGQVLAVMEAMKMEHTIAAPADGEVRELLYLPGDQVAEGAELLKLAV